MSAAQDIEALSAKFGAEVTGTTEFRGEHTIQVSLGIPCMTCSPPRKKTTAMR